MKRSLTVVVLAVTVVCFGAALMAQSRSAPPLPGIDPLPPPEDVSSSDWGAATAPEAADPALPTPIQPITPPNKYTLTIVNVLKEEVMLFRVPAAGSLKFVRKLAHGDVLDQEAVEGERFTAVFTSREPYQMGFTVEKANATWLLRVPETTVSVREVPTGSLMFGLGVNSDSGFTGSIVLNERNFDIFRPATSVEDLFSGGAWRGAGQEFRVEAVPGTQLQRYMVSFREPFLFDSPYSLTLSGYFYQRYFNEYAEAVLGARTTIGNFGWGFTR
jgi:hypothetical protein